MASYTKLADVNTWWDVHGDGEALVLLHSGGADSRAYDSNLDGLAAAFRTYRFDRRGQGRTPDVGGPITFAQMTDDAIAFIETVVDEPVHLIGHSIGAPVGLLVAQKRPDLVRGLVFSEGVFHFEGWLPGVLDPLPPDVHEFLGGLYAEVSPHRAEHWPDVWARLDHEHHRAPALTTEDLATIATPALLMFADNEGEVQVDHIHTMHRALPDAQLACPRHWARPPRRQARRLQPHDHRLPQGGVTMAEPLRGACAAARKRIGGPRRSPHARRSPLRLALPARLRAYLRAPHQPPRTTPQRTRLSPGVAITARTQGTPYGRSSCNTRRFGRFGRLGVPEDPPDEMPGGGRQPGQPALPP
jgi:pimeloyl-ACP methyl ester carboxylesterase